MTSKVVVNATAFISKKVLTTTVLSRYDGHQSLEFLVRVSLKTNVKNLYSAISPSGEVTQFSESIGACTGSPVNSVINVNSMCLNCL